MVQEQELCNLQAAMKSAKRHRDFERYQAVYLSLKGYKQKDIADITGRCVDTIRHYTRAYQEGGMAGLQMGCSSGKPSKLTAGQKQTLLETVAYQHPADVGFPARYNWTLALVVQFIEREWKKTYTLRGSSKLLHSLGLSYTRPTYTLQKADPAEQNTFVQETFPSLKKADGWAD
jgi:transposase